VSADNATDPSIALVDRLSLNARQALDFFECLLIRYIQLNIVLKRLLHQKKQAINQSTAFCSSSVEKNPLTL